MTLSKNNDLKFTKTQLFIVILLALTQFSVILDFIIISPLAEFIMKAFSISSKQFGVLVSSYAFSAAISGFLFAGIADKFDRKKLLVFFYIGFILGTFFCTIAPNYHLLLIARIITGIFGGVIGAISLSIVTDLFPLQMRGRAISIIQMGFAVSQVAGIPIGLFISNHWGWHMSFLMIVAIAVVTLLLLFIYLPNITEHLKLQKKGEKIWKHYIDVITNKTYLLGFLTTSTVTIGGFMLQTFSSPFLINNVGVQLRDLPIVFLYTGIASFIIIPTLGKLSDKISRFILFFIGTILSILMLNIYTHLSYVPLWVATIINMLLYSAVLSRVVPAMASISALPKSTDRGTFMSINASLQQIAGGLGAVISGMIVMESPETGLIEHFDTLGYISSIIMVLCIILVYKVTQIVKRQSNNSVQLGLKT